MTNGSRGGDPTFLYELEREGRDVELIEHLESSTDPRIRYRIAEILGDFRTHGPDGQEERIGRALLRTVKRDDHDAVRAAAIDALYLRDEERLERLIHEVAAGGVYDPPAWTGVESVAEWLDSTHPEFRLVAARAIGIGGTERDVSTLVVAFTDQDIRVRREAVHAVGRLGDPRCVDALAARLRDRNERVRRAAARSLATLGTERALEALVPATQDADASVRLIAVGELGRFGNERPIPLLLEAVDDRSDEVARTATRSLLTLLSNAPDEGVTDLREGTLAGLVRERRQEAVVPHLVTILNGNPAESIRHNGTWLLGRLVADVDERDRERAVDTLLESLDETDEVAEPVASALIDVGGQEVAERVRSFIDRAASDAATDRAERVLERVESELRAPPDDVDEDVEFTYIEDPSEYTRGDRDG